jgi:hypothetical protein
VLPAEEAQENTHSVLAISTTAAKIIAFKYRVVDQWFNQTTSAVVNKADTTGVQIFRLFLYTETCLRFGITTAFAVAAAQCFKVRPRYAFSVPHLICVVKFPWRSNFVIDFVVNSDRRSVRLVVGSAFSYGGLENNTCLIRRAAPLWQSVQIVLKGVWQVMSFQKFGHAISSRTTDSAPCDIRRITL